MKLKLFGILVIFIIGIFALGGNTDNRAYAGASVAPSVCSNCPYGSPVCVTRGFTGISTTAIFRALKELLQEQYNELTNWFSEVWDQFVAGQLIEFNVLEDNSQAWMDNWWAYDYKPALQNMMGQLNTAYVDQNRQMGSAMDAAQLNNHMRALENVQKQARNTYEPSEQLCVAGSMSGSFPRTHTFARAVRKASERESIANLTNKRGSPYENGPVSAVPVQWNRYCNYLADADSNNGNSGCPADITPPVETINADVEPGRFLFNNLTIDVRKPEVAGALEALKENLVGARPFYPQQPIELEGTSGIQAFMDKRTAVARQNVARAVPEYIASLRMPVSGANDLVQGLRTEANMPLTNISEAPSYKEIMHAVSTEKFTSGTYNMDNVGSIENLERESLVLSVFYLMQLREYYELLERGVLALAVQSANDIDTELSEAGGDTGPISQEN